MYLHRFILVLVLFLVACSVTDKVVQAPIHDERTGEVLSWTKAEELLGFKIVLPTYLPRDAAPLTSLGLIDDNGRRSIEAVYSTSSEKDDVRLRITQEPLGIPMERTSYEMLDIKGTEVAMLVEPLKAGAAVIYFLWRGQESHFFVEIVRLGKQISKEFQREATQVIESMIRER